jgi:hypothetical protein
MELANYEIVRYPSGQIVILRAGVTASGAPSSGPRDVAGVFTCEREAESALLRLRAGETAPVSQPSQAA